MQAVLELIAARVDGDQLRFMVARRACPSGIDPDDIAAEGMEALFPGLAAETVVLHSTSWRYENGVLALTYLGYSDQLSSDALPLTLAREAKPNGDDATSVVAHAIRHLAFLTRTEPEKYAKPLSAETLAFLGTIQPDVAGRIHHREQAA